jgi:Hint domain
MDQSSISTKWRRTRRNVLTMGAVLAGLCGCKSDWEPLNRHKCQDTPSKCNSNGAQCYRRGTRILTTRGERPIEDLRIGDLVITVSGEQRPIKWIGLRRYGRLQESPGNIKPVRIARDAFGQNLPHTDLFLSQQHNLFVDGLLIRAVDLVNTTSIVVYPLDALEEIEYLHVRLAAHDVIFAEGLPSETLRFNADSARTFDNFAQFEELYGFPDVDEAPYAPVCAVTSSGGRELLRSYLRSALSPWVDRRNKFEILRDRLVEGA